ncbi:CPNE8-like protein [Mya arenaria]|uniref:CPNE8-like protein n=1 Tax=Mya arenaria TaxID=6604 RepID=A0ABY7FVC2_MYAAR|nr:CPNE8-like protein [Mya arenaria]
MAEQAVFQPGTGAIPATLVELTVMVVMFTKDDRETQWREFGRTEVIWNNLNPDFVKKFVMQYCFEQSQKLKFEVYDIDSQSADLSKHEQVIMQFRAHKLDKKDFFGKSDPFLTFYRANEDNTFTVVHRTEVIKKTLNPTWKPMTLSVRALCNGDYDRHDFIGDFTTSLRELTRGPGQTNVYECINEKKRRKKGQKYQNSGTVELMNVRVEKVYTFLDYVRGGTQMNCTIAIDFTASNGDPKSPNSLHYSSPYHASPYCNALRAVGNIIKDYDSDQLFPALGFGARLPPNGVVSHEFALNGNPQNPFCDGIEGVVSAYLKAITSIQLYGPTNFAPCINHVSKFAAAKPNGDEYFILLIITDGIITDMPQTCEAIVNAASLPMSIIIIGVGDADFEAMEVLDGDDVRLSSRGRYAERDIVQFVPYKEFMGRSGDNPAVVQARLAREVLEEIPDQFLSYMKSRNIKPRPPVQRQLTISSITSLPTSEQ